METNNMCFFRKKKNKTPPIETKFHNGDPVSFRYRGELSFGWVYAVHPAENGLSTYDIQIGGQCPAILYGLKEEELKSRGK